MHDANPYAPPQSSNSLPAGNGCYRLGKKVLLTTGSDLPPRCIRCNTPVDEAVKTHTFYWHHPAFYLLLLLIIPLEGLGFLVYIVTALILRKKTRISPALCPRHLRRRHLIVLMALVLISSGLIGAWLLSAPYRTAILPVTWIMASLVVILFAHLGRVKKITPHEIIIADLGRPFVNSLPPHPFSQQ